MGRGKQILRNPLLCLFLVTAAALVYLFGFDSKTSPLYSVHPLDGMGGVGSLVERENESEAGRCRLRACEDDARARASSCELSAAESDALSAAVPHARGAASRQGAVSLAQGVGRIRVGWLDF